MASNRPRKLTIEECGALDVRELTRNRIFELGFTMWHTLELTGYCPGMPRKMRFVLQMTGRGTECLFFRFRAPNAVFGEENTVQYIIEVVSEPCRYGGKRRYLRCPLHRGSDVCGRRVTRLFLPPAGRYFGCRTCYSLTYRSVQQHDGRVDEISRLTWPELKTLLQLPFSRSKLLVLKGVQKKRERFLKLWRGSRKRLFEELVSSSGACPESPP